MFNTNLLVLGDVQSVFFPYSLANVFAFKKDGIVGHIEKVLLIGAMWWRCNSFGHQFIFTNQVINPLHKFVIHPIPDYAFPKS